MESMYGSYQQILYLCTKMQANTRTAEHCHKANDICNYAAGPCLANSRWSCMFPSETYETHATETNRIHLVLFGIHNRTFGPYLASQGHFSGALLHAEKVAHPSNATNSAAPFLQPTPHKLI
jgi:hypothetical protein